VKQVQSSAGDVRCSRRSSAGQVVFGLLTSALLKNAKTSGQLSIPRDGCEIEVKLETQGSMPSLLLEGDAGNMSSSPRLKRPPKAKALPEIVQLI